MLNNTNENISRDEFVDMIYSQVGEDFSEMLAVHEMDDEKAPFINLEEQNIACTLLGIDISARNNRPYMKPIDRKNRIVEIRRELTEKIIGLFYDILVEDLTEVPDGRGSDVETLPDRLKGLYTLKNVLECPLMSEAILFKMRYLLKTDKDVSSPNAYAESNDTLMNHMWRLRMYPPYKDKDGKTISNRDTISGLRLPEDQSELTEALTVGIPYGSRDNKNSRTPYLDLASVTDRYSFVYPDVAKIISLMYAYRNGSVHKANWKDKPLTKKFRAADSMVLVGLIITAKNLWPLTLAIYRRNDNKLIGAVDYCEKIVDSYINSPEYGLCCEYKWILYDKNPGYVKKLNISERDTIKKIALSLRNEGQGKANLLQGTAGCGKSWAMRNLNYFFARTYLGLDDGNPGEKKNELCAMIPVYIPVVSWYHEVKDADSIIGIISRIIINNSTPDSKLRDKIPEGVREILKEGRLVIIFDGVDECPYEEKGKIYRAIDQFVNRYSGGRPTNLCIISDREISVENQVDMILYTAEPIKDRNIKDYVRKYLIYTRPDLIDEENKSISVEKEHLVERIKTIRPAEEIKTAFELAKLTEICANEEVYNRFVQEPEEKRKYTLDLRYLKLLLEREAKEKLKVENLSPETHLDSLTKILKNLSERFDEEDISAIEKGSFDDDIMAITGGTKELAQTYRKHLIQAGILKEYQDMIDLNWYYSFATEDMKDAVDLL